MQPEITGAASRLVGEIQTELDAIEIHRILYKTIPD